MIAARTHPPWWVRTAIHADAAMALTQGRLLL